jgi:predicted RNase H-like HicB family nuclease
VDSGGSLGCSFSEKEVFWLELRYMKQLSYDKIIIAYDDSQNYYCIWQPLISVGLGKTEAEAFDYLRAAAHVGIEAMVDLKLSEIEKNSYQRRRM